MKATNKREAFLAALRKTVGDVTVVSKAQIKQVLDANPEIKPPYWLMTKENRAGRGTYSIPALVAKTPAPSVPAPVTEPVVTEVPAAAEPATVQA